jgi:hypothetical protein
VKNTAFSVCNMSLMFYENDRNRNQIGLEHNNNDTIGLEECVLMRKSRNDTVRNFLCSASHITLIVEFQYLVIQVINFKYFLNIGKKCRTGRFLRKCGMTESLIVIWEARKYCD